MGELGFDFSKMGYCGILSDSFAVIWCDNDPLFRRLLRFREALKDSFTKSEGEISHIFRSDGVYYKAVITRLVNNDIMCRIFPATEKTRLAYSTIYNSSVDICHNAFNILNLSDSLFKNAEESEKESLSLLSAYASEIYDHGLDILHCCGSEKGEAYISLKKYIFDTFYRIEANVKVSNKLICPVVDISASYIKIDYNLFEIAMLNMIKLFFLLGDNGDCFIAVSDNNEALDNTLSVRCAFLAEERFSENIFKASGRTIKSLFIAMNGIVKLKRNEGRVEIIGSVPVKLKKVKGDPDDEEILFLSREIWEHETDEQVKLYRHTNGSAFRMNVISLDDIEEKDNLSSVLGFLYDKK